MEALEWFRDKVETRRPMGSFRRLCKTADIGRAVPPWFIGIRSSGNKPPEVSDRYPKYGWREGFRGVKSPSNPRLGPALKSAWKGIRGMFSPVRFGLPLARLGSGDPGATQASATPAGKHENNQIAR